LTSAAELLLVAFSFQCPDAPAQRAPTLLASYPSRTASSSRIPVKALRTEAIAHSALNDKAQAENHAKSQFTE